MGTGVRVRGADGDGVTLWATGDRPLDVCLDGRRVWTFWSRRDTVPVGLRGGPLRKVGWPRPLVRHLDGVTQLQVRDSATGEVLLDRELRFGEGSHRVQVRNEAGAELGFDKSGKLVPTFAGRSSGDLASLLDATESVIASLRRAGVEPFLAYGTLLGAVREGKVLGHDSDADLGYVSRFPDPADVARESFRVQRALAAEGWETYRYSGAAFRVSVAQAEGSLGLDVFGGFLDHGRLYLMGEVGTDFRPEWLHPLGECDLEGRPMPVPAQPDRLLAAMYGEGWRVPDPAFRFTTPERTVRALDGWFRGTQPGIRYWERRAHRTAVEDVPKPSLLARRAVKAARARGGEVLDVGAGRGVDSLWVARQGVPVTAYDYVPAALDRASRTASRHGLDLRVRRLNLTETRWVLAEGARLAHDPRPRVVLARHVLDATSAVGRESLARLCSMALRQGGLLLAEFHVDVDDTDDRTPEWLVGHADVEEVTTLLREAGATRVRTKRLARRARPTVRLVGEWSGAAQESGARA